MPSPTHACVAGNCSRQIPHRFLMCPDHWAMVPAPLKQKVLDAWAEKRRAPWDVKAAAAHARACNEARLAVNGLLAEQAAAEAANAPPDPWGEVPATPRGVPAPSCRTCGKRATSSMLTDDGGMLVTRRLRCPDGHVWTREEPRLGRGTMPPLYTDPTEER